MQLENEAEVLIELLKKHVERNAHVVLNQEEYESKYNELAKKYEEVRNRVEDTELKIANQKEKRNNISIFIKKLEVQEEILTDFDETLWNAIVDKVERNGDGDTRVVLKNLAILKL